MHLLRFTFFIAIAAILAFSQTDVRADDTQARNVGDDGNDPDPDKDPCGEDPNGCVNFTVSFPLLPNEPEVPGGGFRIYRSEPTPALFTPQGLWHDSAVLTAITDISQTSDGRKIKITNQRREPVAFFVPEGESVGRPVDDYIRLDSRIELLNSDREPTESDPAFVRQIEPDESWIEYAYDVGFTPLRMKTASGRIIDFTSSFDDSFELILKGTGLRQLRGPAGLVDIVVIDELSYEIRFYSPDDAADATKSGSRFVLPSGASPYRVITVDNPSGDPDQFDHFRVTDTQEGYTNVKEWEYDLAVEEWELTEGNGQLVEKLSVFEIEGTDDKMKIRELRDADGDLVSRLDERIRTEDWGEVVIEEIEDPEGNALTTSRTYITDASADGYGKLRELVRPDGSWERYEYDAKGRRTAEILSWMDQAPGAPAGDSVRRTLDYAPVDPLDEPDASDARPRTIVTETQGVETARTYHAYYTDVSTGEVVEIEERATAQGTAYGDASNLRTVRRHYPSDDPVNARAGRLKSVAHPDGTVEAYDYTQDDAFSERIETRETLALVGGVAQPIGGKSLRTVTTRDPLGNILERTRYVYDGTDWALLSTETQTYSDEIAANGYRLLERTADGRTILEQAWTGPLVAERTDESGVKTAFFYDALDRVELEVKIGHDGRPDIATTYDRSLGAIDCGCDGSRSMSRSAGGITLTSSAKTDTAGRRSEVTDENGYTTTYEYQEDGRITIETRPDGSTRITSNYLDGRLKSITGTGVIPEYYTYSVNPDGTQTTRVETASEGSPRFRESTFDLAGRLIREESPAFDGGTITRTMEYNDRGLLARQTETGRADTLFEYDELADLVRSGLDIDGNGELILASVDRITDTETTHQLDAPGHWFEVSTTTVYPESGSASGVVVSTNKRRLSGFTADASLGMLASEQIAVDVRGNETVTQTWIDRAAKTVTRLTDTPDSDIDAVATTVNGLLLSQNSATVAAPTTFDYDAVERRIAVKDPRHDNASQIDYYTDSMQVFQQIDAAGNATTFEYYDNGETGAGQAKTVTDALGQKSHFAYDLLGRQSRTWGETDYPQEYGYNTYGELATLTTYRDASDSIDFTTATWPNPSGGDATTWTYDEATGLLTRKEYADENGTDYTYDSANRLAVRTWARGGGLDTTYGYDPATGELLTVDYEDPGTADITYTYDRLGRQLTVTDATGTRSFDYDDATLQLDTETLDASFYDGLELTRSYDTLGRASGYALGGTSSVSSATYTYDTVGRLKTVSDGSDTFTYGYEPDSNLLASLEGPVHASAYAYEDNRDVMTEIDNRTTDLQGASLSKYGYTYDDLGRRDDRTQSGSAINTPSTDDFSYNPRSEVIGSSNDTETAAAWNPTFDYDKIGNRLSSTGGTSSASSVTYETNALNQYTQVSGLSSQPSHDADGNLTSDGGNWTYTWNNENRLSSATDGTVTIDFTYDYQGRLVKKDDGTDVEVYVYDGWNRIATFLHNSSFTLQTSYLWGMDLSGSMQGAGGVGGLLKEGDLYPTYDANGNIMQKLDGTGAVAMSVDYDPFGNVISGTLVGEYGFSTKPLIDQLDWYYYGFRYYDPGTGRWPSRDPIEERGGKNLYQFAFNNPVNLWDLLGQSVIHGPKDDVDQNASCCIEEKDAWDAQGFASPADCREDCFSQFGGWIASGSGVLGSICSGSSNPVIAAVCAVIGTATGSYALSLAAAGCPLACEINMCVKVDGPTSYWYEPPWWKPWEDCETRYRCPDVLHTTP